MSKDTFEQEQNELQNEIEENEFYENEQQKPLNLRPYGNSGVKGVIYDYKEAREHAEQRLKNRVEETKRMIRGETKNITENENEIENEIDELDELEKELFGEVISAKVFKERQKPEIMKKIVKRRYGDVIELDEEEYMKTITELEDDVYALIHIYTSFVKDCISINRILEDYSKRFQFVCFGKITWEDSNRPFPEEALPCLLLYKGDCMVKSLFGKDALPFLQDIFPGLMESE